MKTLLKIAARNNLTIIRDYILFDGNAARATDLEVFATETGAWNFTTPTLVSVSLIKSALALSKKPVWLGDTLNGIKLVSSECNVIDYPIVPFAKPFEGVALTFNGQLSAIVDKLMPACANKDVRYYLNGIYFDLETGAMVTTDGHRLHIEKSAFTPTFAPPVPSIIVPRSVFDLVQPTGIEVSNECAKVYHAGGFIITKLIDGKFPEWQRVVPDLAYRPHTVQVNGAQLESMNKMIAVNKAIKSKFGAMQIHKNGTVSTGDIILPFCQALTIDYRFNATYLADALKAVGHGSMHLGDSPNDSATIIAGNFQAVIIPTRI